METSIEEEKGLFFFLMLLALRAKGGRLADDWCTPELATKALNSYARITDMVILVPAELQDEQNRESIAALRQHR